MPDTALTTRVTEETFRRLKLEAVLSARTVRDLVESALDAYLASLVDLEKMKDDERARD